MNIIPINEKGCPFETPSFIFGKIMIHPIRFDVYTLKLLVRTKPKSLVIFYGRSNYF
jgi:hypothetical protein